MSDAKAMIRVLLDGDAPIGDRDDAAMDLEWCEGDNVIRALAEVASNEREDPGLIESAAESLGGILARAGLPYGEILEGLTAQGRARVTAILEARAK